jgi:hypothetical protein
MSYKERVKFRMPFTCTRERYGETNLLTSIASVVKVLAWLYSIDAVLIIFTHIM